MAPSKKAPAVETVENLEKIDEKLVGLLTNEPSDLISVQDVKLTLQRPTFPVKYKAQAWSNKKLKEMEITSEDTENSQISFYISYFGVLNSYVTSIQLADKSQYSYDPEVDTEYKFLLEKYVMEELFNKGENESIFVFTAIDKFLDWQNSTKLEKDELGKS